jgi:hypothetical protein
VRRAGFATLASKFPLAYRLTHAIEIQHMGGRLSSPLPDRGSVRRGAPAGLGGKPLTNIVRQSQRAVEAVAREAVRCSYCFEHLGLQRAQIAIAQPRWVGPNYSTSSPKVVVVMLNPAAGEGRSSEVHSHRQRLLEDFRNGSKSIVDVFDEQARDFPQFGRGRFLPYLENSLGVAIHDVALLNMAWCATKGDTYPDQMFEKCYALHTSAALMALAPEVVVLCGQKTRRFLERIAAALPKARVFQTIHYAHRKSLEAERSETAEVRDYVSRLARKR